MDQEQRKIFKNVVKANLEHLSNACLNKAEDRAITLGNRIRTNDEVRELALSFFQK